MPDLSTDPLQESLLGLLEKYGVPALGGWRLAARPNGRPDEQPLLAGWTLLDDSVAQQPWTCPPIPLLPWRHQRRFVELRRLVQAGTVDPVLMVRFSCQTDPQRMPLVAVLYREFDLAEWLLGAPIAGLMASINGPSANVVLRMAGGVVVGVEAGAGLPAGSETLDRHELIARRGVASDRVVDTQVPQSSVYLYGPGAVRQWTDTDAELYGLSAEEIDLVRAAFEVMARPEMAGDLRRQHARLARLVRLALESDQRRQRLDVEGDLP